ncbi:MAG: hypothetical protein AAFV31_08225 [Pseudomonadota bacterium]
MGDTNMKNYYQRLDRIGRTHNELAKGYVTEVTNDGLIVHRPRRVRRGLLPWRGILFVLVMGMLFKALLLAYIGEAEYASRVASLQAGTTAEQVGAFVMKADPVTQYIAGFIAPYIK